MKERPILFSEPMVRAIIEGRKTQTRRLMKPQPACPYVHEVTRKCPLGTVGDRLWVREAFGFSHQADDVNCREQVIVYRAGHPYAVTDAGVDELKRCKDGQLMEPNHFVPKPLKWYGPTQLPRWASRITLEITEVRVQRLHDISEDDVWKEGVDRSHWRYDIDGECWPASDSQARQWFRPIWESIHGHDSWELNPWVWAISFNRVKVSE